MAIEAERSDKLNNCHHPDELDQPLDVETLTVIPPVDDNNTYQEQIRSESSPNDVTNALLEESAVQEPDVETQIKKSRSWGIKYGRALKYLIPIRGRPRNKECPFERVGLLSILTFHWIQPLMWQIYKHGLKAEDIWSLPECDSAHVNAKRLDRLWRSALAKDGDKASLWKTIWRFGRTGLLVNSLVLCLSVVISFLGPAFVLRSLLSGLEKKTFSMMDGLWLALLFTLTELLRSLSNSMFFTFSYQMGIRIQAAVSTLVYDKILRLRYLQQKTAGDFVNLFSSDSLRLFSCIPCGQPLISGPLISTMALIYLYCILGPTVLIGFSVILLFYPLQILLSRVIDAYRRETVKITDSRVRLMNEVLTYVKLIKMYAWEVPFSESVKAIRRSERRVLQKAQFLRSTLLTLVPPVPTVAAVLTLIAHTQLGYSLSVAEAFTLLAVFGCVRPKLSIVPAAVLALAEAKVAADRFEQILKMEEIGSEYAAPSDERLAVQFVGASLGWDVVRENEELGMLERKKSGHMGSSAGDVPRVVPTTGISTQLIRSNENSVNGTDCVVALREINLCIAKGSLVAVCGKYGSGKSSLLAAVLGQMKLVAGSVCVSDDVAYVSQQSFVLNATVRDNVLFGAKYDEQRYKTALHVCQLNDDLTLFPSGDQTEIGERGINLSGGQKQRLSLARAVFSDRQIYLLDDVLSAVDVAVGGKIFTKCIKSHLKSKTVILVTHQLQYLKHCDQVIFIQSGRIKSHGKHDELMSKDADYARLVYKFEQETKTQEKKEAGEHDLECEDAPTKVKNEAVLEFSSVNSIASTMSEAAQTNGHAGQLVTAETRNDGAVSWAVYKAYIQSAGGVVMPVVMLFIFTLNLGCNGVSNWWLSYWLSQGAGNAISNGTDGENAVLQNPDLWFYNAVHAGILGTIILTSFMRSFFVMKVTLRASSKLHDLLFRSVMRGRMSFFDTTPAGRILNRFARDVDDADTKLPILIDSTLQNVLRALMALLIISIVFPYFLAAVFPLLLLFLFIQRVFRFSLQELKRLENLSRSPLLSHVMCTVQGLYTLQAYRRCEQFGLEYRCRQDKNSMLIFLHNCAKRWLTIRLDLMSNTVLLLTAVFAVVFRDSMSPAYAGLALDYAVQMTGLLQYTLRIVIETETSFTAVERLDDYIENIESDKIMENTSSELPLSWPSAGAIRLESVRMRYRPGLPFVLRDVSADLRAGEKIGIVGRTGSGKSSLCMVLFRLVELSSGRILIDDVDISNVSLHVLRSRLAIIPQEPVLFAGSVRYNLDPFSEHSDDELWNVLHQCHMAPKIKSLPGKLDYVLVENGANFSVGERQLVCMARALLRNSKILIMDEATAAVDAVTDSLIQETIASSFSGFTVLIIAHRLNTVRSCDKILVLKRGKIVEFDTPHNLLVDESTLFSHMNRTMTAHISDLEKSSER